MKIKIKAIIFDFGGVLVDWSPHNLYKDYFSSTEEIDAFLEEIDFYTWNAEQDRGRPFAEGVAEISAKFPHHAEMIKAYADNWIDSITGETPDVVALFRRLKAKGYPVYGLSNWSAETFPLIADEFSFFDDLDEVVLSGEVNMVKPEPEIYELLLSRIPERADECLFIDDSLPNIVAAQKLGFQTFHFKSAEKLEEKLKEYGLL